MASKKKIIGSGVDVQTAAGVSALVVDETTGAATVGPSGSAAKNLAINGFASIGAVGGMSSLSFTFAGSDAGANNGLSLPSIYRCILVIQEASFSGNVALLILGNSTVTIVSDPNGIMSTTDTDGKFYIYCSTSFKIKNRYSNGQLIKITCIATEGAVTVSDGVAISV